MLVSRHSTTQTQLHNCSQAGPPGLADPRPTALLSPKTLPTSRWHMQSLFRHGLTCQQKPLCTLVITPIGSAPEGSFHAWLPAALSSWQLYISIE